MNRIITLTLCALVFCTGAAVAASFTPGNLVIYRVGDGTGSLVNTGAKVFLDEYTTNGTLVQSIELPSNPSDPNQLVASGTATSEGLLTRSVDGLWLFLTGYRPNPFPYGSQLNTTLGSAVNRVVGRVNAAGTLSTMALADFSSGNNPRSATSTDGSEVWMVGGAGGLRYAAWGDASSIQVTTSALVNIRQVKIFNNQLYVSTGSGAANTVLMSVSGGLPTTTNQYFETLPGLPSATASSVYSFVMADLSGTEPGLDTLYVAMDTQNAINKYCLSGGTWQYYGAVVATNYRGLDGVVSGTAVTLYSTTGGSGPSGGGTLATVTDSSGYQGTLTGTLTVLATAAPNTAFRGVALAPIPEPGTLALAVVTTLFALRRR
ncbi:MAG: hypothetical protein N2595_10070 [bacterium]|nr:hypothetical protein [bacterium]